MMFRQVVCILRGKEAIQFEHSVNSVLDSIFCVPLQAFEGKCYYWNVVVFLRKIALIACSLLLYRHSAARLAFIVLFLLFMLLLNLYAQPFRTEPLRAGLFVHDPSKSMTHNRFLVSLNKLEQLSLTLMLVHGVCLLAFAEGPVLIFEIVFVLVPVCIFALYAFARLWWTRCCDTPGGSSPRSFEQAFAAHNGDDELKVPFIPSYQELELARVDDM